ncbi:MAG: hypothetical protein Q9208_006706 [Pyrenodesmia sp. 3 TL-2023]
MDNEQFLSEKHQASSCSGLQSSAPDTSVPVPSPTGKNATAPPTGPPAQKHPPAHIHQPLRILLMHRDGFTYRHMTITDKEDWPLYRMDQKYGGLFNFKPHMTISRPAESPKTRATTVGTANFHRRSTIMDLEIHGHPVPFYPEKQIRGLADPKRVAWVTRSYAYQSPAFKQQMRWEMYGNQGADMMLVDERRRWLARFDTFMFMMKTTGRIEVVGSITGAALDEIVVGGCAMVQHEKKLRVKEFKDRARVEALARPQFNPAAYGVAASAAHTGSAARCL